MQGRKKGIEIIRLAFSSTCMVEVVKDRLYNATICN